MKTTFILSFALLLTVVAVESRNLKSSTWQLRPVDLSNEKNLKEVTSRVEKVLPEVGNKSDPKSLGWNYKLDKVLEAYDLVSKVSIFQLFFSVITFCSLIN